MTNEAPPALPVGLPAPAGRPWPEGTPVVYAIRASNKDRKAHGGFLWPESGLVEAPDWNPVAECGGGLHGCVWGIGDWSLLRASDPTATWQVVEVPASEVVDLGGKSKFPRCWLVHSGGRTAALCLIAERRMVWMSGYASPVSSSGYASPVSSSGDDSPVSSSGDDSPVSSSGNRSPVSSSGNRSPVSSSGYASPVSSSGNRSPVSSSGNRSPVSSSGGDSPVSSSGNRSPVSSSGNRSPVSSSGDDSPVSSSGDDSSVLATGRNAAVATCGKRGRASAGPGGVIAIAYHDADGKALGFATGVVGVDGIEAGVWYAADAATGKLVPWSG